MPYFPPLQGLWSGQNDTSQNERFREVVKLIEVPHDLPIVKESAFAFVGFACDIGSKRNHSTSGATLGPKALREALAPLPLPLENAQFYDCGNIVSETENLEEAQDEQAKLIEVLLKRHIHPIVLGGGHEVALGNYIGIANAYPQKKILIANFDAYFGLEQPIDGHLGSSGTVFRQIANHSKASDTTFHYNCYGIQKSCNTKKAFAEAKALNVNYFTADEFHLGITDIALEQLDSKLAVCDIVYVSISLVAFAAAFAPGVSTRHPLGLCPWHVLPLINRLRASGKVVCLDISDLSPARDHDGISALLGANLIHHYLTPTDNQIEN